MIKGWNIRWITSVPFFSLIALGFVTGWALYLAGSRAVVRDLVQELSRETALSVTRELSSFLESAQNVSEVNATYLENLPDEWPLEEQIHGVFLDQLERCPALAIISVGYLDGEYYEAQRQSGGDIRFGYAGDSSGGVLTFWPSRSPSSDSASPVPGAASGSLGIDPARYDPRDRPWFQGARAADGPLWSEVYPLWSDGDLVITSAVPFGGFPGGVTSVVVTLGQVGAYLSSQIAPERGVLVVFDEHQRVVAASRDHAALQPLSGSGDPLLEEIASFLKNGRLLQEGRSSPGLPPLVVDVQGERLHGAILPLANPSLKGNDAPRWKVAVFIQEGYFTAPLVEADRFALYVMGILFCFFFLLAFAVAKIITSPLQRLQVLAEQMDLRNPLPSKELEQLGLFRNEVGALARSLLAMSSRLHEDYSIIRTSLHEKESLLREVHHRVKNNLQIVSSLLSLQASRADQDAELQQLLETCQNRLHVMASVHEMACGAEDVSAIEMEEYLTRVAASCGAFRQGVALDIRVRGVFLPLGDALPCGLIAHELVENAFRYAFPGKRSGQVSLEMYRRNGNCVLSVRDDGVGIPPEKAPSFPREGLGFALVNVLAEQLGAVLQRETDQGVAVTVSFEPSSFLSAVDR
ncbi:Two-component sensor histidine kinase, contains HisKA and HATPase domains [Alkalispirochaeta americana]|uniref:histidine kinase n=1 Tax=Alkalispirochaeta americana TaxID=159291 RepID=A0A1N6T731_9SPIO|nr:histidine kinase dimerization/phosphoacceptor domain -containing protein [Alkalispirochaeta americana]SIQ49047.1 Two-component sensor histidine kinase, contains HisKA and HATPase domains [Alkalispirochaeta americana]